MKKLLLILLTLITIKANAQSLVDTNKVWNVVSCLNFGPCGTTVFSFGADTTIGTFQYKKLIVNRDSAGFAYSYPIAAREDTITKRIYFYENGEYLAYDFSLNQGDTFTTSLNGCNLQMTPNPFTESTILSFENPLHEINILKIFNMQGQIVREYSNVKGNEIQIDREKMNDGIYFFLIMNEKRIVANGSLIIN